MERASKIALGLEALVLAYPTFLGLVLSIGAIAPFATGSITTEHALDAAAGIVIVMGLASGWYLLLKFLIKGRDTSRSATKWWLTAATVSTISTVIALLYWAANLTVTHGGTYFMPVGASFGVLGYGVLFLPSFLHLSAEVWGRAV